MSASDRLTRNLPHLQNLIKRDADAYREDVNQFVFFSFENLQRNLFSSNFNIFISKVNFVN